MRAGPDIVNSIDTNAANISGCWLWSSEDVYPPNYSAVLNKRYDANLGSWVTQPISVEAVTVDFLRWKTAYAEITIRVSPDPLSAVVWAGAVFTVPDDNGSIQPTSSAYTAGVLDDAPPVITDLGTGSISVAGCSVSLYTNTTSTGSTQSFNVAGLTLTPTDNAQQFLVVDGTGPAPIYRLENSYANINHSNIVMIAAVWRIGTSVKTIDADSQGKGLANKLARAVYDTMPYLISKAGGLRVSETSTPAARTLVITAGTVYAGAVPHQVPAINSSVAGSLFWVKHVSGAWTYQATTVYDNNFLDDGAGTVAVTAGNYSVAWVYRAVGGNNDTYFVKSATQYASAVLAEADAQRGDLPLVLAGYCKLVARIIILQGASSGIVQNVADVAFTSSGASSDHNSLSGLQGGTAGQYYHLSSTNYTLLTNGIVTGIAGLSTSVTGHILLTNGIASVDTNSYVAVGSPAGGDLVGTYPSPSLKTTGVVAGTYGSESAVPVLAVDLKGRITGVVDTPINIISYTPGCTDPTPPALTDNGSGSITLAACHAAVYKTSDFTGKVYNFSVASATFTVPSGTERFVCVKYNTSTGVAEYVLLVSETLITGSDITCLYVVWNYPTGSGGAQEIHSVSLDSRGLGLPTKTADMMTRTQPYTLAFNNSLTVSETVTPASRTLLVTSAVVYAGVDAQSVLAFDSSAAGNRLTQVSKVSGVWSFLDHTRYNNTQYSDGTDTVTLGANRFGVRWIYRSIGDDRQVFEVLGTSNAPNAVTAQQEPQPSGLPALIQDHCILIGRIIIQYNATSGIVENVAKTSFTTTVATNHNNLNGLQGNGSDYYHLDAAEYAAFVSIPTTYLPRSAGTGNPITGNLYFNAGVTEWFLSPLGGHYAASLYNNSQLGTAPIVDFSAADGCYVRALGFISSTPSNGFLKANGTVDTSTYLISSDITDTFVTGKLLTGFVVGANTSILATDSLIMALGKAQGQLNNKQGLSTILTSLAGLSPTSTGMVKLTNGVASLDSTAYLPASGGSTNKLAKWISATGLGYSIASDDGSVFLVSGEISTTAAITMRGSGSGTYNAAAITCDSAGINIGRPRATDSASAAIRSFSVGQRGGGIWYFEVGDGNTYHRQPVFSTSHLTINGATRQAWGSSRNVLTFGGSCSVDQTYSSGDYLIIHNNSYNDGTNNRSINATGNSSELVLYPDGQFAFSTVANSGVNGIINFPTPRFIVNSSGDGSFFGKLTSTTVTALRNAGNTDSTIIGNWVSAGRWGFGATGADDQTVRLQGCGASGAFERNANLYVLGRIDALTHISALGAIDAGSARMQSCLYGSSTAWFGYPGGNTSTYNDLYGIRIGAGWMALHATTGNDVAIRVGGSLVASFASTGVDIGSLSSGGIVKADATTGRLKLATSSDIVNVLDSPTIKGGANYDFLTSTPMSSALIRVGNGADTPAISFPKVATNSFRVDGNSTFVGNSTFQNNLTVLGVISGMATFEDQVFVTKSSDNYKGNYTTTKGGVYLGSAIDTSNNYVCGRVQFAYNALAGGGTGGSIWNIDNYQGTLRFFSYRAADGRPTVSMMLTPFSLTVTIPSNLKGQYDGSDATSGHVGEYVADASISNTSIAASGTTYDCRSISLTAGDWDVTAIINVRANIASLGRVIAGINTTSAVILSDGYEADCAMNVASGQGVTMHIKKRISTSTANFTAYLSVKLTSSSFGAAFAWGSISARRIR